MLDVISPIQKCWIHSSEGRVLVMVEQPVSFTVDAVQVWMMVEGLTSPSVTACLILISE